MPWLSKDIPTSINVHPWEEEKFGAMLTILSAYSEVLKSACQDFPKTSVQWEILQSLRSHAEAQYRRARITFDEHFDERAR